MTVMQIDRAVVEQVLEALEDAKALLNNKDRTTTMWFADEITALRAALAQKEEPVEPMEPVAWRSENANPPGGYVIFQQYPQALADLGKPIQPLYTAPPPRKRVPLTEEEIGAVCAPLGFAQLSPVEVARAVERAHGIKE